VACHDKQTECEDPQTKDESKCNAPNQMGVHLVESSF
jgi:hypothetical protein